MSVRASLSIISYTGWCGLGFFRGINSYKYNYNKYNKKEEYLYVKSLCYGFARLGIYGIPSFLPLSIYKEIYRLEVNLRNLENEKNTNYYNRLL